jgi:type I restriction enzyme S subunit
MNAAWTLSTIGDTCEIVNGGTPKTGIESYWGGQHWWITPAEMGDLPSPYVSETRRTLTDDGIANSSARLLPPNSVILSSRAPIGHLVINTVPMATNQGCKGLVPCDRLTTSSQRPRNRSDIQRAIGGQTRAGSHPNPVSCRAVAHRRDSRPSV